MPRWIRLSDLAWLPAAVRAPAQGGGLLGHAGARRKRCAARSPARAHGARLAARPVSDAATAAQRCFSRRSIRFLMSGRARALGTVRAYRGSAARASLVLPR